MLPYTRNLKKHARDLRKNMTESEKTLWVKVRRKQLKGFQFYRQRVIGNYIVDFYCPATKLVIELDGGQHYDEKGLEKDRIRENCLRNLGLKVLRFTDREVFENLDGVLEKIWQNLNPP